MGRPPKPAGAIRPTEAELAILDVLWTHGPATVREVHEALARRGGRAIGYTTALKLMQIMADKGWATRDESARSHVYAAAVGREAVQGRLLDDLVARAFSGSRRSRWSCSMWRSPVIAPASGTRFACSCSRPGSSPSSCRCSPACPRPAIRS
jgi:BlaI family penicillinase repressor